MDIVRVREYEEHMLSLMIRLCIADKSTNPRIPSRPRRTWHRLCLKISRYLFLNEEYEKKSIFSTHCNESKVLYGGDQHILKFFSVLSPPPPLFFWVRLLRDMKEKMAGPGDSYAKDTRAYNPDFAAAAGDEEEYDKKIKEVK